MTGRSERLAGFLAALLSALAGFALPLHAQQPSPKPITLAAIIESMEARERLADSVVVRWNRDEQYSAGALLEKASTWTSQCEMLLKGGSMRYVGTTFSHSGASVTQIHHVSSYDGKESRFLQGTKPPLGHILVLEEDEKGNTDAGVPSLRPLMLYFRPLAEPYNTLSRKTLKLLDERKTIDGRECVSVDDGRTRVYVDRDRDFVPVAFDCRTTKGRFVYGGTLEYYHKRGAMQWLPKAFHVTMHFRGQNVADRIRGEGVQTEIGVPLKDSDFVLKFEPGTIVWDARTREEYRILSDGSKEPIERRRRRRAPPK